MARSRKTMPNIEPVVDVENIVSDEVEASIPKIIEDAKPVKKIVKTTIETICGPKVVEVEI